MMLKNKNYKFPDAKVLPKLMQGGGSGKSATNQLTVNTAQLKAVQPSHSSARTRDDGKFEFNSKVDMWDLNYRSINFPNPLGTVKTSLWCLVLHEIAHVRIF
jgi:hypothetical protein